MHRVCVCVCVCSLGTVFMMHDFVGDEMSDADRAVADKYEQQKVIGNGSFGVVYQAKNKVSGEVIAIKTVLQDRRYKVSRV